MSCCPITVTVIFQDPSKLWIDNSTVSYQRFTSTLGLFTKRELESFYRYYDIYETASLSLAEADSISYNGIMSMGLVEDDTISFRQKHKVCGASSLAANLDHTWFFIHCAMSVPQAIVVCEKELQQTQSLRLSLHRHARECPVYFVYLSDKSSVDKYWCVALSIDDVIGYRKVPSDLLAHDMLNIYLTSWSSDSFQEICVNCRRNCNQCMKTSALPFQQIRFWSISEKSKTIDSDLHLTFTASSKICSENKSIFCKHIPGKNRKRLCNACLLLFTLLL